MSANCCGGQWDMFLQKYRHKQGCPTNQVSSSQKAAAKQRMDQGAQDAFRPARSLDSSYRLGKDRAEKERIARLNPIVGGRRRRGPLL